MKLWQKNWLDWIGPELLLNNIKKIQYGQTLIKNFGKNYYEEIYDWITIHKKYWNPRFKPISAPNYVNYVRIAERTQRNQLFVVDHLVLSRDKLLQGQARFEGPLGRVGGQHVGQVALHGLQEGPINFINFRLNVMQWEGAQMTLASVSSHTTY
jgi:hypothetical protein